MTSLHLFLTDKPAIAPPVFVFQKDKAQKRSAEGSSAEDGEDSDKDEGSYCPPVKRERTSSFPPPHSVPKNNVFMPSSFCQSPTGNSDSEPDRAARFPSSWLKQPISRTSGQSSCCCCCCCCCCRCSLGVSLRTGLLVKMLAVCTLVKTDLRLQSIHKLWIICKKKTKKTNHKQKSLNHRQ
uniref:RAN binding protein 3b n=1 Tax=Poecilia reticulata TaxID=8081 RepID=A0A3P9P723_POERE